MPAAQKAAIQLGHGGGHTPARDICGETPVARRRRCPQAHPVFETTFETTIIPEAMTKSRIDQCVSAFAAAAARAPRAGFDCVEIQAAHGYLISPILTPFENRRSDEHGGVARNRARASASRCCAPVRAAAPGVAVIFRLSVEDYFPEGMPWSEGRQVAIWAAEGGADALHVAAGHYRSLLLGGATKSRRWNIPTRRFSTTLTGVKAKW